MSSLSRAVKRRSRLDTVRRLMATGHDQRALSTSTAFLAFRLFRGIGITMEMTSEAGDSIIRWSIIRQPFPHYNDIHTCIHTGRPMYSHIRTHTCIPTHTHTYTYTQRNMYMPQIEIRKTNKIGPLSRLAFSTGLPMWYMTE